MQATDILRQRTLPGKGHGEKERVQLRLIKALSDIFSGGNNQESFSFRHCAIIPALGVHILTSVKQFSEQCDFILW